MNLIENGPDMKVSSVLVPTTHSQIMALKSSLDENNKECIPMFSEKLVKDMLVEQNFTSTMELYQADEYLYVNIIYYFGSVKRALESTKLK